MRLVVSLLLLALTSCAPPTAVQQLPTDCEAQAPPAELLAANWLQHTGIWRLRQVALLEIGPKKIPLEGFLRLDLQQREARLVAMNEMGVVLFDLQVTETDQQLKRAIPQLQKFKGLARGIAQSLRRIFLQPLPQMTDHPQQRGNSQRLWRLSSGGSLGFVFDCNDELRTTRQVADAGDWQVTYDRYRSFGASRLPEQIAMNDYRHGVKLSLWIREVKQEP
jgi:hypothetical protein